MEGRACPAVRHPSLRWSQWAVFYPDMELVAARCQSRIARLLRLPGTVISQQPPHPLQSRVLTTFDGRTLLIRDINPFTGLLANGESWCPTLRLWSTVEKKNTHGTRRRTAEYGCILRWDIVGCPGVLSPWPMVYYHAQTCKYDINWNPAR